MYQLSAVSGLHDESYPLSYVHFMRSIYCILLQQPVAPLRPICSCSRTLEAFQCQTLRRDRIFRIVMGTCFGGGYVRGGRRWLMPSNKPSQALKWTFNRLTLRCTGVIHNGLL